MWCSRQQSSVLCTYIGGKSLVAEVLMLARMYKAQQAMPKQSSRYKHQQQALPRALLVLPYLSIVAEKTAHMSMLLEGMKWQVQGYKGATEGQPLASKAERIAICSIEKANIAINNIIKEQRLHELVSVVVDEAHMLADTNRGAALEMLLSKLVACRASCKVQIICMSATMSGLDSLSDWLDAQLFLTNFRPVPLFEHVVFEGSVFLKADKPGSTPTTADDCPLVEHRRLPVKGKDDKPALVTLVAEVVNERHSVLVFCLGRHAAESCASMLAAELVHHLGPPTPDQVAARQDLLEQLRITMAGYTNKKFEGLLASGVGYHHAGLTHQERSVVEEGYRSGALLVLTATSTLAAGVNLPARRVILRSLWQGVGPVGRAQYLQMVGRAGRAGQSAVGESFLMGKGAVGVTTSSSEWSAVCKLITAPLPALTSQLVTSSQPTATASGMQRCHPSTSSGGGQARTGQTVRAVGTESQQQLSGSTEAQDIDTTVQPQLQQLLLHGVSTGLVNTGQSVVNLIKSTLAFHQLPWDELAAAVKAALTALRARKLVSLRPDSEDGPSYWTLTPLGTAVVASTLPPDIGLMLHIRLSATMCHLVMAGHMHLLYQLQAQPLFDINDWSQWCQITRSFNPQQRRVAELEGVQQVYIDRRLAGMRGDCVLDQKHARLAAAWLMDQVITDASCVVDLEEDWGKPGHLTLKGISRGQFQSWQSELSKTAAMATLLAGSAGWWQLETLLAPLAAQAAAGVRPELLPLMEVPGMQPAHAAALHAAGFHRPELLVCASESELAAALAAKLPGTTRKRSKDMANRGVDPGSYGSKALVARAAKSLLEAARQHAVMGTATHIMAAAEAPGQMASKPKVEYKPVLGQATVYQVRPTKQDPLLQKLLDGWQLQPSFSFAVLTEQQACSVAGCKGGRNSSSGSAAHTALLSPGTATVQAVRSASCCQLHCRRPIALVLCWTDKAAAVLHLPYSTPAAAADVPEHAQVWSVIKEVFGDAHRTASCCNSAEAIAALHAVGINCSLTVDDPCVAFLLWQPRAYEQIAELQEQQQQDQGSGTGASVLKAAQVTVLGSSWKLLMPLLDSSLADAARAALLTRALTSRMRAVLVQQQLCEAYESVERPLQRALGTARATGLQLAVAAVQQWLHDLQWQQAMLQQRASQLQPNGSALNVSQPSHVQALLHQLHLGSSKKEKRQALPSCLQQAVRCALRNNQQQHLPLLRCMLTYWQINELQHQMQALLQYAAGNSAAGSSSRPIKLQPVTEVVPLCGELAVVLPAEVHLLLSRVYVPYLPVMISECSIADHGISSVTAGAHVMVVQPLQQQQQQPVQYMSVLHSLSQLPHEEDPQLPFGGASQHNQLGCVRHFCSITNCMREEELRGSQLHALLPVAGDSMHGSVDFVPASLSLLAAIQPCQPGRMFVQLHLEQLPLLVIAALSKDENLQVALSQIDPVAAAARHWFQHSGLPEHITQLLLSHIAAGAVHGTPVPQADVQRAMFSLAMDALVHGRSQSLQRSMLAVDQPLDLAESLLHAFPRLAVWRSELLAGCGRTGYLASLTRKHPFKLPPGDAKGAELRALREAERTACSMVLLGSCGDVERVAAAALHHCCGSCFDCDLVMAAQRMLVVETSASAAFPFLKASGPEVQARLKSVLGLGVEVQLPFRWALGTSLDVAQSHQHKV